MLSGRLKSRTAARLSAAIGESVRCVVESLEGRRLLNAGQLNTNFASTGVVSDTSASGMGGGGVVVQSTGKTVTLGEDANHHAVLARYNANGSLDTTFGSGGKVVVKAFTGGDQDLALAPGDKLVIGGGSTVARFNADGSLDTSFAGVGYTNLAAPVTAVAVQTDGKIVTGGTWLRPSGFTDAEFQRLNVNGSVDGNFGSGGIADISNPGVSNRINDITIEQNGVIAGAGDGTTSGNTAPLVLEVASDGTPININFYSTVLTGTFNGVAQALNGDLIAVGSMPSGSTTYGVIVDFPTTGSNAGQATGVETSNALGDGTTQASFSRVAVQFDGGIVVAGVANPSSSLYVVRLNSGSFGDGGTKLFSTRPGSAYNVDGVALTADGAARIVAGSAVISGTTATSPDLELFALTGDSVEARFPAAPLAPEPDIIGRTEAENFDRGGEGVSFHDTEGTNLGGQYRTDGVDIESTTDVGGGYDVGWTHTGEYLKYTFQTPSAENDDMMVRVANYGAGGSFHVEINGTPVTGSIAIPDTGGFQNWVNVDAGKISVPYGHDVVKIVFDGQSQYGFSGNVNSFSFTPVSAPPPGGTPFGGTPFSTNSVVQAEDFNNGGEGVAYQDTEPTNLGGKYRTAEGVDIESTLDAAGGYDVGWIHTGEYLNYTGTFAAGNYDFSARVANLGAGGSFHVNVDGVNVTGAMAIPDTGGFQNWTTISKLNIPVSAGTHLVQFVFDGQSQYGFSGNLNLFSFDASPAVREGPYGGVAPSVPGVIQAENYDVGGEGFAFHDTTANNEGGAYRTASGDGVDIESLAGGGYAVDYTHSGEYMKYTVNVSATGTYTFDAHLANYGTGATFSVYVDGTPIFNGAAVPDTNSFVKFADVTRTGVQLSAGQHTIAFVWDTNSIHGFAGNLDWFSFT